MNPKDAILEINGKIKPVHNGVYEELLPFGRYQYKAYCQNYHETVGQDRDNTHNIKVNLKAAHGYLSVTNLSQKKIAGATVQGDQYRHGINYYDPKDKNISLQDIWKKVKNDDFMKDIKHAGRNNKDYGQYKPDYVYVYERIQRTKIGALLNRIVDDILKQKNANRP